MKIFLGRHYEVRGREAQKTMDFFTPMDLSRYGDLTLNVILTSLIFFFPSGLMLKLFLVLIISHVYIYIYDRYRVLRAVPAFDFSGYSAESCTQALMSIPCGFLASCIVFKGNCLEQSPFCMHGFDILLACSAAFFGHVILHLLLLFCVVPRFSPDKDPTTIPYSEAAEGSPCTWFSGNPIHCLRSQHIYKHSPPCSYFIRGREYLMQANKNIGCYYQEVDPRLKESERKRCIRKLTTEEMEVY